MVLKVVTTATTTNGTVTQINAGTGINVSPSPITGNGTVSLANTTVTAGSYGNASTVAQVTINAQGQVTNAVNVAITVANTSITGGNITIGNTTIGLGNTATSIGNLTLANVTIVSGRENLTSSNIAYNGASSNLGSLSVGGPLSSSDIGIISSFVGNASTYSYVAIQNSNSGNSSYASISTINNGFTAYSDLGTNSTTYDYAAAGFPNNAVSAANASFLLSYSGNLAIGTWNSNTVHFLANASSATTSAMTVNPNNTVTIASLISSNVAISGGTMNVTIVNSTANTTANATFATSSLPLVPAGYIVTNLNGTLVKVPYYAV